MENDPNKEDKSRDEKCNKSSTQHIIKRRRTLDPNDRDTKENNKKSKQDIAFPFTSQDQGRRKDAHRSRVKSRNVTNLQRNEANFISTENNPSNTTILDNLKQVDNAMCQLNIVIKKCLLSVISPDNPSHKELFSVLTAEGILGNWQNIDQMCNKASSYSGSKHSSSSSSLEGSESKVNYMRPKSRGCDNNNKINETISRERPSVAHQPTNYENEELSDDCHLKIAKKPRNPTNFKHKAKPSMKVGSPEKCKERATMSNSQDDNISLYVGSPLRNELEDLDVEESTNDNKILENNTTQFEDEQMDTNIDRRPEIKITDEPYIVRDRKKLTQLLFENDPSPSEGIQIHDSSSSDNNKINKSVSQNLPLDLNAGKAEYCHLEITKKPRKPSKFKPKSKSTMKILYSPEKFQESATTSYCHDRDDDISLYVGSPLRAELGYDIEETSLKNDNKILADSKTSSIVEQMERSISNSMKPTNNTTPLINEPMEGAIDNRIKRSEINLTDVPNIGSNRNNFTQVSLENGPNSSGGRQGRVSSKSSENITINMKPKFSVNNDNNRTNNVLHSLEAHDNDVNKQLVDERQLETTSKPRIPLNFYGTKVRLLGRYAEAGSTSYYHDSNDVRTPLHAEIDTGVEETNPKNDTRIISDGKNLFTNKRRERSNKNSIKRLEINTYVDLKFIKSKIFKNMCMFFARGSCNKDNCKFHHTWPAIPYAKFILTNVNRYQLINEYNIAQKSYYAKKRYIKCFLDECVQRGETRITLEIAFDVVKRSWFEHDEIVNDVLHASLSQLHKTTVKECDDILELEDHTKILHDELIFAIIRSDYDKMISYEDVFQKLVDFVQEKKAINIQIAQELLAKLAHVGSFSMGIAKIATTVFCKTNPSIFKGHNEDNMTKFKEILKRIDSDLFHIFCKQELNILNDTAR